MTASRLRIRFGFLRHVVDLSEVVAVEVVDYRPIRQFGGWGWRWGREGTRQFAMSGATAVKVTQADDRAVFLGSDDPANLAAAIERAVPNA